MSQRQQQLSIDIAPLLEPQWTGIPVFTRRLIQALQSHSDIKLEFAINFAEIPPALVANAIAAGTGTFLREEYITRAGLGLRPLDSGKPILFPSTKSGGGGLLKREASVVHDLSTLFMPEYHEHSNVAHHLDNFEQELRSNEVTFCISDSTKVALTSAFSSTAAKARLIYQYVDWPDHFEIMDANLPPVSLGRFAIVIGTIEPRKNLSVLLRSLSLPEILGCGLTFLVVGRRGWLVDEFLDNLTDFERQHVRFTGYVSEFVKYRLLKACEFLIFPSIYEGFGIPALEAMSLSKPVLGARSSSLPEVIGDGGLLFDPFSPSEFAAAIVEMGQPQLQAYLAPKAMQQSRAFHPARMAEPICKWLNS